MWYHSFRENLDVFCSLKVIVSRGDVSTDMFIVQMGEAEVLEDKYLPAVAVLKKGDIFGEVSWLMKLETGLKLVYPCAEECDSR